MESHTTALFSVDTNYCYRSFNRSHAALMKSKYNADIELGKNMLSYISVDGDREIVKKDLNGVLKGERAAATSHCGQEDLSRPQLEISYCHVRGADNKFIGVAVIEKDMTEYKQDQELSTERVQLKTAVTDNQSIEEAPVVPGQKACATMVKQGDDGIAAIEGDKIQFANLKLEAEPTDNQSTEEAPVVSGQKSCATMVEQGDDGIAAIEGDKIQFANPKLEAEPADNPSTEEAPVASEQKIYATMVEQGDDGIMVIEDDKIQFANPNIVKMTGYPLEEVLDKCIVDFVAPEYRLLILKKYRQSIDGKETENRYEVELIDKRGERLPVEINAKTIEYQGKVVVMAVIRDVCERKNMERLTRLNSVLKASRDVNQLIARGTDRQFLIQQSCDLLVETQSYEKAWVLLIDKDRNFISAASAGFEENLSVLMRDLQWGNNFRCIKQMLGQQQLFVVYNDVKSQCRECYLANAHCQGSAFISRLEYHGTIYGVIAASVLPMLASDTDEHDLFQELAGNITFALASIDRDRQLKESERTYRELTESICDMFFATDNELRCTFWNKASEELTGIPAKDALGKHLIDIFPDVESAGQVQAVCRRVIGTRQPQHFMIDYPSGKNLIYEVSVYPSGGGIAVSVVTRIVRGGIFRGVRGS